MQTFKRLALAYTQRNVSNQSPSTFITYFSFATLSATLTSSTLTRKRSILYQRASDRLHSLRICHCSFEWKIIELFRIERYRKMNTRDGREQVICLLYYYRSHRTCYTCNIVLKHVLYTSHQIRITSGEQIQIDIDFWKVDIYLDLRRNRSLRYVHNGTLERIGLSRNSISKRSSKFFEYFFSDESIHSITRSYVCEMLCSHSLICRMCVRWIIELPTWNFAFIAKEVYFHLFCPWIMKYDNRLRREWWRKIIRAFLVWMGSVLTPKWNVYLRWAPN